MANARSQKSAHDVSHELRDNKKSACACNEGELAPNVQGCVEQEEDNVGWPPLKPRLSMAEDIHIDVCEQTRHDDERESKKVPQAENMVCMLMSRSADS